jgi:predicted Zn-dependent peptidase
VVYCPEVPGNKKILAISSRAWSAFLFFVLIAVVSPLYTAKGETSISIEHLPDGITVALTEMRNTALVGVSILIHGGTLYETEDERGTYSLIPKMLMRGTVKRTSFDIKREISLLGGWVDLRTEKEYWVVEAKVTGDNLQALFMLLRDLLFNPLFPEKELEKEKNIAIQSIRRKSDSPVSKLFDLYRSVFYPDFYSTPSKTIENIQKTNRDSLYRIHQKFFRPDNMVISIAGNFKKDETIKLLDEIYGIIPRPQEPLTGFLIEQSVKPLPDLIKIRGGLTQAGIIIGTRLEGFDRWNEPIIEVLDCVLVDSMGGRLFEELRKKLGLVYNVDVYYSLSVKPYTWMVIATTRKRNLRKVIKETKNVLQDLIKNPPTEDELRVAKEYVKTRLALEYQCPAEEAYYAGVQLMRNEKIKNYNERIEEIEMVSREEIITFLKKHFTKGWTVLVLK